MPLLRVPVDPKDRKPKRMPRVQAVYPEGPEACGVNMVHIEDPMTYKFRLAGQKGGVYEYDFKVHLIAGPFESLKDAVAVQMRERSRGMVTRCVRKIDSTHHNGNYLWLVYGIPYLEIMNDPRVDRRSYTTGGKGWSKSPMADKDFFTNQNHEDVVIDLRSERKAKKPAKKASKRVELKHRNVTSEEHGVKYLYEIHMVNMPKRPKEYFHDVIKCGESGWVWTGPGTAIRRKDGIEEYCQVV